MAPNYADIYHGVSGKDISTENTLSIPKDALTYVTSFKPAFVRVFLIKQCGQSAQFKILLASPDIETMKRFFLSNVKHVGRWEIESRKLEKKTISSFLPCLTEKRKSAIDEEGRNDLGFMLSTIVELVDNKAHLQRDNINNEVRVITLHTQFWKGTNQKFLPAIVDWATKFDSRHKSFEQGA